MQMRLLIVSLVVMSLFTACGQPSAPAKTSTDAAAGSAAIRSGVDKFLAAWNKGDSATYGAMLASDAVLMGQNEPSLQGRDSIAARMAKDYDVSKFQQTATVDEVIMMGDRAYARGTWTVSPTGAAGADAKTASGKWSILYQRAADGTWLASRWMWNQDSAPQATGS